MKFLNNAIVINILFVVALQPYDETVSEATPVATNLCVWIF